MANLSNINNKFIVTDGGNGRVLIGATNDIGATLFANHPSTTAPSLTFNAPAGQVFENEDLQIAFGLNNASPYNGYMQTRFVSAPYYRNLAINPLGGNVGIGTNSPTSKLHLRDPGVNSDVGIKIGNDSRDWNLKVMGSVSDSLQFFTHDNSNVMTILPSGNVGIGVIDPGAKLEVKAADTAATTDYATKVIKAVAPLVGGYTGTKIISLLGGFDGAIHAVDFGYGYNTTGYDMMLSTNDNTSGNPIERLRINSTGSIYPPTGPITGTTYYGYDAGLGSAGTSHNTYYGYYAGRANTGTRNVFIGSQTAYAGTNNLNYNVLIGYNVLRVAANTCESNVVIGDNAAGGSSGFSSSVVIGQAAANSLTGNDNVVVGYGAYYGATTGERSVIIGHQAGNAANAIGPVIIGWRAGYVNQANSNIYIGQEAGRNNTSGASNVFIGVDAGYSNVTGSSNTYVGTQAAVYQTGLYNTALGHLAMGGASGTGTGQQNTAIGNNAGRYVTNANQVTYVGRNAGLNTTTGQYNTGIGSASLQTCTIGAANTAIGLNALYDLTDGNNNTTIGLNAGFGVTTGINNLFLGANSGRSTASGGLGNITSGSNQIQLGNNTSTNFLCKIALTVTSDKRDKTNFKEIPLGLDFVSQLKPTSFEFKKERESNKADGIERYGFLAQEILELEGDKPVIIDNENLDSLKYTSDYLIPVLVKAIQELKAEIELLKNK